MLKTFVGTAMFLRWIRQCELVGRPLYAIMIMYYLSQRVLGDWLWSIQVQ